MRAALLVGIAFVASGVARAEDIGLEGEYTTRIKLTLNPRGAGAGATPFTGTSPGPGTIQLAGLTARDVHQAAAGSSVLVHIAGTDDFSKGLAGATGGDVFLCAALKVDVEFEGLSSVQLRSSRLDTAAVGFTDDVAMPNVSVLNLVDNPVALTAFTTTPVTRYWFGCDKVVRTLSGTTAIDRSFTISAVVP